MLEFEPVFPHETRMRIPMAMVDPGNVVYHSRYLDLYHDARDQYMEAAGYDYRTIMDKGMHLAVVDAHLLYKRPVRYLDTISVKTRVAWMRSRSLGVVQEIWKKDNEKAFLCNSATISLTCIGPDFTATHIPQELADTLTRFQGGPF